MFGGKAGTEDMFAEPFRVPGRTIAGGIKKVFSERERHEIESCPLNLCRERCVILTPCVVAHPLLSVILIPSDNEVLRCHRVDIVG